MIDSVLTSWLFTAIFTAAGAWLLLRRPSSVADWIGRGAHVLMSAAMIAMTWPWGMSVPALPQEIVFGLAALWFLAGAVVPALRHCTPAAQVHHALMMAAMVWMLAAMPLLMGGHHQHAASNPLVVTANLVLGGYLVLSAVPWASSAFAAEDRALRRESASHGAMSVGMGAMFIAMAA